MEGVSAGIVGLDPFGAITLVNARAAEMLGRDEISPIGQQIGEVIPPLAPILDRAKSARRGQVRDQIEIGSGPDYRTYQVQLTREGTMTESPRASWSRSTTSPTCSRRSAPAPGRTSRAASRTRSRTR